MGPGRPVLPVVASPIVVGLSPHGHQAVGAPDDALEEVLSL